SSVRVSEGDAGTCSGIAESGSAGINIDVELRCEDAGRRLDRRQGAYSLRGLLGLVAGGEGEVGVGNGSGCPGAEDVGELFVIAGEGSFGCGVEVDRADRAVSADDGEGQRTAHSVGGCGL